MLETMYAVTEESGSAVQSVSEFCDQFIDGDDAMEDKFFEAVRDSRLDGYKEGLKAAFALFSEIR